ncbi:MAG: SDR family NAD(P)-dependent oxidoreductase, partial [Kiloniellales bacterium]
EPGTTPFYVNTEKRPWLRNGSPRRAGVSAFGFGGSNFHCVLEEYQGAAETVDWDGRTQILAFSGPDRDAIGRQLESFEAIEDWRELRARAAELRAAFDAGACCRLLVVEERKRATRLVSTARELLHSERASNWSSPQGIYFGSGPKGKVAALFPGQGSLYPNMLRDLACQFPIARETLGVADQAFGTDRRLSELVYPHAAFDDATRDQQKRDLQSTDVAQPAIGTVSLVALRILESFGFTFDAAAGHSYGELTALHAAGRLDSNAFHLLSKLRGKLMAEGEGDRGSMLAVTADRETINAFVQQHDLDLVVANRNAPEQMVLSGATSEIDRAEEWLRADNFTAMRLVVAAAFHSPFVAEAAEPFAQAIANIELGPGNQPVFANTTGKAYPPGQEAASKLLAEQLAKPVEFVSLVENLADEGVTIFVEIGPGRHLSGLVQKILHDRPLTVTAIDASRGKHCGQLDLARTLAQLCASGLALDLSKWDEGAPAYQAANGKKRLTISVSGANLFEPKFSPPTHGKPAVSAPAAAPQPPTAHVAPAPAPAPAPMTATADSALASSTLDTLLRLQEQTADLHRQFLDGQAKLLDSIQAQLTAATTGSAASPQPAHSAPIPEASAQAQPTDSAPKPAAQPNSTAPAMEVASTLLAIVAEKTGYPTDMLELSMGLDADLGIDSIKRVEILSALQQRLPGAPAIGPEHLGELQTLGHIVDFLGTGMPAATAVPPDASTGSSAAPVAPTADVEATLLAIVADKTGYPEEMLELSMGLDADLGIDSIKRVEILSALQQRLPTAPIIRPEHLGELQTLADICQFLSRGMATGAPAVTAAPTAAMGKVPAAVARRVVRMEHLASPVGKRLALPAGAPIWITRDASGLGEKLRSQLKTEGFSADLIDKDYMGNAPGDLAGLLLVADAAATDADMEALFALAQKGGRVLSRQSAAVFATVSRLDGAFGFQAPPENVLSGGLAGLAKTAHCEWTTVTCKAVDLDAGLAASDQVAERILGHVFGSAPVEIGVCADAEVTPVLELEEVARDGAVRFTSDDVVVISGGARGITAEIAVALATAGKPHLALLGRTALPGEEPAWLACATGQVAIQKALLENAPGKPTPKELQADCHRILADREIRDTLARIEAAGSRVSYHAIDVRDSTAVAVTLETVRAQHGAITGLVHGAGVLADSFIADKSRVDFEQVYGTKVEGLRALLAATSGDHLRGIVLFSSSSARFGRKGQVDYAMGNEILNKVAQRESRARSDCKVLSINWGPWDGGMVTPALRKLFTAEGIEVIGLAAGAKYLLRELATDPGPVEIVILGDGSVLPEAVAASATPIAPALAAISLPPELPRVFERELDFETTPCLRSHVMDGNAVLPAAMVIEWFGHGALHNNPGLRFCGFEELRIFKGVIIAPGESLTIRVCADRATKQGQQFLVPVEFCSGPADHKRTIHARATIVLGAKLPARKIRVDAPAVAPYRTNLDEVYAKHLFHGPAFQGLETIEGCSEQGIVATARPAPLPREWIRAAPRSRWIADPLSIDCAF